MAIANTNVVRLHRTAEHAIGNAGRRTGRRRRADREIRIIPIADADRRVPSLNRVNDDLDDGWDALGAEALCMLHLSPDEVEAAIDQDLATSRTWLLRALGRAMDQRD